MRAWPVGLWGPGWEMAEELKAFPPGTWRGRHLQAAEVAKVYNLAEICPNIHHPQTRLAGVNMRTFEILAAGGFQLVDHIAGLEENFEVGREIVSYDSPDHFRELAAYYLAHPEERAAISERGRTRVLRDHTYEQRLLTILRTLPR
jgi:spore maturation protein CgeB